MLSQIPLPLSATLQAQWAAATEKHGVIGEAHLFLEVLEDENDEIIAALLALSGVSREEARLYAQSWLENEAPDFEKKRQLSQSASQVLKIASLQARQGHSTQIETHHVFLACVSHRRGAHLGEVLRPLGLDAARLRRHLRSLQSQKSQFTVRAAQALEAAQAEMRASFCGRISTAHLLLGLLSDRENIAVEMLERAGCDGEELRLRARQSLKSDGEIASPQKRFSPGAKRALERAEGLAKASGHKFVDCGHLLLALLPQNETPGEKWRARGRKLDSVEELWTAEQVAALRLQGGKAVDGVARKWTSKVVSTTNSVQPRSFKTLALCFATSLIWSWFFIHLPKGSNSFPAVAAIVVGLLILFGSGIGTCVAMLSSCSPRAKGLWADVFGGWLTGMIVGMYLFIH